MMRMPRSMMKALGLVALLTLAVLVVDYGAQRQLLPTWRQLLTEPVASWAGSAPAKGETPSGSDPQVKVEAVAMAPLLQQAPPPALPVRMAGRPLVDPTPKKAEDVGKGTPQRKTVEPESIVRARERAGMASPRETTVAASHPESAPESDAVELDTAGEAEQLDPAMAQEELAQVLRTGGDLVREGLRVPRLIVSLHLPDLEALVARGYGLVVVQWGNQRYRVVPPPGALLHAEEFVVLTREVLAKISNRGLDLNRAWQGRSWHDTPLRPAFRALEERLQAKIGGGAQGEVPIFTFFASGPFDAYLARKQLGSLTAVGLDPRAPDLGKVPVATVGTIVLTAERPVYLIRAVRVGAQTRPWSDPEAVLLGHRG